MGKSFYVRTGKRCFDAASALGGLMLISPLLLSIALAIRCTSPGTIFFRQARIGQFGRPFRIWKFRTMIDRAECNAPRITAGDDTRITRLGRWLRKTKIDELPQLLNVLVGEMSLVGPRPEILEYAGAYENVYQSILRVKPGITGPAANAYFCEETLLAGRTDAADFYVTNILAQKLQLDLRYCENICFAKDLRWILATFQNLFEKRVRDRRALVHADER